MSQLVGIYLILAKTPIWLTALVLWLATDGAIHLMRDKLEGLGYQTAFSAKFGDAGLLAAVLIGATILQRGNAYIPPLLQIGSIQMFILVMCLGIGAVISKSTNGLRSGQVADMYHDTVIGPAILFLAITLVPVIWYNARWYEGLAIIIAVVVWASLVYVDLKYERFNQRQWLVHHGFAIKGEIPKW